MPHSAPQSPPPSGRAAVAADTLLLCPQLLRAEGGIERISRVYLEALSLLSGPSVRLVVLNDRDLPPAQLAAHAPGGIGDAVGCDRSKMRFFRAVLTAAPRRGGRVLATHAHLLPALALARLANPSLRHDVVLHGVEAWAPLPLFAAIGLRRARHVYCVSQYTADRVAELRPSLRPRLRVLPNALPTRRMAALNAIPAGRSEPGRMLAVSRLAPHDRTKGVDHLIAALPSIRSVRPDAALHIVGEGLDRPRLEALAAASPARAAIFFHGRLGDDALDDQFARCRIFTLPSEKEGFGLVYAEALAAGRPCVAARAGGAPEVVGVAGEGGLLAPFGDVPALAATCAEALGREWDPDALRARAGLFSLARFSANFVNLWNAA